MYYVGISFYLRFSSSQESMPDPTIDQIEYANFSINWILIF
jgi:hypothetical protein